MSTSYKVKSEDERLDSVLVEHYGHSKFMFQVLEDNPSLKLEVFLPLGFELILNDYEIENEESVKTEGRLWL